MNLHKPHVRNSFHLGHEPVRLIHLDFERLRATRYTLLVPPWFVAGLLPVLTRGQGQVPGSSHVGLDVARQSDGAQFMLTIDGQELITGGVAWGLTDRRSLYAFLVGFYEKRTGSSFPANRPMPGSLPWLGTVRSDEFAQLPRRSQAMLLALSRRLAVAIISHALASN